MIQILTHNVTETEQAGGQLASRLSPGAVVAFTGDLGAGKTAFCRGFLHALGYTGRVTSPTFAIVNEYETELCRVCHFDMYRILDEDALYDIGWDDYFDGDEVQALLQEAVATLPEVQRAVFCLRYYDEMKYAEMSKLLEKSEGSLKASYHIAVQKVSEYIKNRN